MADRLVGMALEAPAVTSRPGPSAADRLPEQLGRRYLLDFDTDSLPQRRADVLVVGSGIAGLTAAIQAAGRSLKVSLVTKGRLSETSTWYAQGGIAGAVGEADSVELHLADTLVVGQGLCEEEVVRAVVSEAVDALEDLGALGVAFDREDTGAHALAREGGHSLPRVLHSGDATGAAIQSALTAAVRRSSKIGVYEERFLVDLLTAGDRCVGAVVMDRPARTLEVFWASAIVLATGGCGQAYRVTTNPPVATGDGVAAAWRSGAEVADLEFVQFHPTALDGEASPRFLITEALRGEGAYLLDAEHRRFMTDVHPLAELAPRDVVSREIERVIDRTGEPHVWLDARHLGADHLRHRFPTIWDGCAGAGFDLTRDLVPVAPAAHYFIGGVRADVDGRTTLPGLFASGEAAASGLHGANRLASNSLLEGLVLSRRIVRALAYESGPEGPSRVVSGPLEGPREVEAGRGREMLQKTMSAFVGVTRSAEGLEEAAGVLAGMAGVLDAGLRHTDALELQNLLTVSTLVTHAAWLRTESRGAHFREDFPGRDDTRWLTHTVWSRGAPPRFVLVGAYGRRRAAAPARGAWASRESDERGTDVHDPSGR